MSRNIHYIREIEQDRRAGVRWYVEIDTINHGTLKLCEPGEESGITDGRPWLSAPHSVTGMDEGIDQVQDATLVLTPEALDFTALEPLENKACRVYRYRGEWAHRDLLRKGRVWGPVRFDPATNEVYYAIVGNMAFAIDSTLPERALTLSELSQLPEENQNISAPMVFGAQVSGQVPMLVKAGGWGYLSEDMPAGGAIWEGSIKLRSGEGTRFSEPGGSSTTITINYPAYSDIRLADTSSWTFDLDTSWNVFYVSATSWELFKSVRNDPALNALYKCYRGALGTTAGTWASGTTVYEVGIVQIDSEYIIYTLRSSDGLFQLIRGVDSDPQKHFKGAKVIELHPVYQWMVSTRGLINNGIYTQDVHFYDSAKARLIKNPFQDIEVDRRDTDIFPDIASATVTIKSPYASRTIGLNGTYTADNTAYENVDMTTATSEDDSTGNWTNTGQAIDESGADPHAIPPVTPATAADYVAITSLETKHCEIIREIFPPEGHESYPWASEGQAIDGNDSTAASAYYAAGQTMTASMRLAFTTPPTNPEQIFRVVVASKVAWTGASYGLAQFYGGSGINIAEYSSSDYVSRTFFQISWHTQLREHLKESMQDGEFWTDSLVYFHINFNQAAGSSLNAYVYECKVDIEKTSHGIFRAKHGSGVIANKAATLYTTIQVYISGGTWEASYDNDDKDDWTEFTGAGWHELTIDGSESWSADEDWQKYIRIRPKYQDQNGQLYHCRLVNYYQNYGNWSEMNNAIDGNPDTNATYQAATGGAHNGEFYQDGAIDSSSTIERVRVRLRYKHDLSVTARVSIGAASGGAAPPAGMTYHDIGSSSTVTEAIYDVTEDHPGTWDWDDFNVSGTHQDFSIYINVEGVDGESLELYAVEWDIITGSATVDPKQTPMVLTSDGIEDSLSGIYTDSGGIISNPADVYQYLLRQILGIGDDMINVGEFETTLRDYFDDRSIVVGGVIKEQQAAADFLRDFRSQFGFDVLEINEKLTPRVWPDSDTAATQYIHPDNSSLVGMERTPIEDVINSPIALYAPRYYNSDLSRTILFDLAPVDTTPRIRKKWYPGIEEKSERIKRNWQNRAEVAELSEDHATEYALAVESYNRYGQWFSREIYMSMVRDATSARALMAEIIRRRAFQHYLFRVAVDADPADKLRQWDVVFFASRHVPIIPNKTEYADGPWDRPSSWDGFWRPWGDIRGVKCVVLSIKPLDGGKSEILLEEL